MAARLPVPGSDGGSWGALLNDYLSVSHNTDGTLKQAAVASTGTVTSVNNKTPVNGNVTLAATDVGALTQSAADARYVAGVKRTTAPASPVTNDLWYDSTNDLWKRWNGTAWVSGSLTQAQLTAALAGYVVKPSNGTASATTFLRGDNTWAVPAATSTTNIFVPWELSQIWRNKSNTQLTNSFVLDTGQQLIVTGSLYNVLYSAQIGGPSTQVCAAATLPGSTGAWYCLAQLSKNIVSSRIRFRFRAGGSTRNSAVAFGVFNSATNLSLSAGSGTYAPIHISITPDSISVATIVNGTFTPLAPLEAPGVQASVHSTPLATDSLTYYDCMFVINQTTGQAVVQLPDGTLSHYQHANFMATAVFPFSEATIPAASDAVGEILEWQADTNRQHISAGSSL